MISKKPGLGSEGFLRDQLEAVQKEAKILRGKVDQLQKENETLKRSLFELSTVTQSKSASESKFFNVNAVLVNEPPAVLQRTRAVEEEALLGISANTKEKGKDSRHLYYKYQLEGHTGAVYCIKFSPTGKILASGAFDKTVRLWDTRAQKELLRLEKHSLIVSDICWFKDSNSLISGSFDQTCNIWEVETGKAISSFAVDGFVQSLAISPADPNIFACGTTRKNLSIFDRRKAGEAFTIQNESMVNAVYVSRDGTFAITGDSAGFLKTWDLRTGNYLSSFQNEPSGRPISHIHASSRVTDEDLESRYLAVNSYDNVLRVYDRGSFPPNSKLHLLHGVKGHRNKNWPIRSSFFHGKDHVSLTSRQFPSSIEGEGARGNEKIDDPDPTMKSIDQTLLLATGSADSNAYVFDVGGREGTAELVQRLEGHTDRVYSVNFHPTEPILATCSADFTIKIWFANRWTK